MCGIVGFWQGRPFESEPARAQVLDMAARIHYRGPDDFGAWVDPAHGVALGHRRLAIVDTSPAGHQPMQSASGRYWIAYNGEIYNHEALREELERSAAAQGDWRGHSDTETLLAAIEAWGLAQALRKCIGMFAIALWDRQLATLSLARDRMGEKPLYYGWQPRQAGALLFASELKALRAHPAFDGGIDPSALTDFLRTGYVPTPECIHVGLRKLEPGTIAVLHTPNVAPEIDRYWSLQDVVLAGTAAPSGMSGKEAVDELETLLRGAVRQQMVADVPLGAFLSGGVDSSTIVALMQTQSMSRVRTFTIGFHETGFNEAVFAKEVARHLGTEHTELYVSAEEAMQVVPDLPRLYDEPFADASQIPTHLVARLARRQVTVALSGDAGDELFGGYNRYLMTHSIWNKLRHVPQPLRAGLSRAIRNVPEARWDRWQSGLARGWPGLAKHARLGSKMHKGARALASRDLDDLYQEMVSIWQNPERLVADGKATSRPLRRDDGLSGLSAIERMMALDAMTYLPDDVLVKVDRAAMAVSLETRVPMLDHRVVEWAWKMPMQYKLREGVGKWALREVLYRHVPRSLIDRPKMGFSVPIDSWIRGPLRDWAENLLSPSALAASGLLQPAPILQAWQIHLSGAANMQYQLWNILMFQAWYQEFMKDSAGR